MAVKNEKAMGTCRPPMASILIVTDLWVTLPKVKIKEVKAKEAYHSWSSITSI